MSEATIFSKDPVEMAEKWRDAGAKRLHIVDLDGAFAGEPKHLPVLSRIHEACPELDIQVGGGIRLESTVESILRAGAKWVVVGTLSASEPDRAAYLARRYMGRVLIGLDARGAVPATKGWSESSHFDLWKLVDYYNYSAVCGIIYTDIEKDGMMSGPNLESNEMMLEHSLLPVIASGGVSSLDDLEALAKLRRLKGVIVGRALYEGAFTLAEAQAVAAEHAPRFR